MESSQSIASLSDSIRQPNPKVRNNMKSRIRDQAEGNLHQIKGNVTEGAGKLIDNPALEAKGTDEKIAGKVQKKISQVKELLGK